jgi:hypothetical protein
MDYKQSTVNLSIKLEGTQKQRGIYSHYHKIDPNGKDVNGVRTERPTSFTECKKTIHLANEFVINALAEPPGHLKNKIKIPFWKGLPEEKRIALHVNAYINATHPEHHGYVMEIM